MTSFLFNHFDKLKACVLQKAGYEDISPADCKFVSAAIYKVTGKQISETTLKRIYGFAYSKFKPSLFTLNAMSKYCGFCGWEDFCANNDKGGKVTDTVNVCWENIKISAEKITNFTLQVLKNKSGIPYNQTIKRKFIDDHLDAFAADDYVATALVAPAGYGKTLALCHWIEERMTFNRVGNNNDIVLFFSSSVLINVFVSGKDINEWILSLIGYGMDNDFLSLLEANRQNEGKFYLIIDGLDEHMFKNDQFHLLFNQIMDVLSFYSQHESFKLILTMRTATWINYRHEMDNFTDKWFMGFKVDNADTNVPLFNVNEIRSLCTNINPSIQNFIGIEVAENFNHPLYFQFYYKQHKDDFSLNNVDHVCIYELISIFILNKIYLGAHSTEKTLIVKALVEAMDLENEKFEVHKFKVYDMIKTYNAAYNDLLGIGFIREVNKSVDMQFHSVVQFSNENFLNYSIARFLLFKHNNLFNKDLITEINTLFKGSRKVQILKWCTLYAIKNGQQDSFNLMAETNLMPREKSELIIFLGDMFEKACLSVNKAESMVQYFNQDCSDELFNYFFGFEFINGDHKKTLRTLLKFGLTDEKKILIHTSLAMIAYKQLDSAGLEEELKILRTFPSEKLRAMIINPLNCLEACSHYFKHGIVRRETMAELTKFYFNPPEDQILAEAGSANETYFLLSIYTLTICNAPAKVVRMINALGNINKKTPCLSPGFVFLTGTMTAEAHISLREFEKAKLIYEQLSSQYQQNGASLTSFIQTSFYALSVKIEIIRLKADTSAYTRLITNLSGETDFKLIRLQALFFILDNSDLIPGNESFLKTIRYEFTKMIRAGSFSEAIFRDSVTTGA
jgi:hypothetical protein